MSITFNDTHISTGSEAEAKVELALALKAMAEAAKALAERMSVESYGVYIAGDTIHNHNSPNAENVIDELEEQED